jgi:hypothetical protein
VYVGGQNLDTHVDYQNNLALDKNNVPYVIFPDGLYSGKATVMEYTGSSWTITGNAGFSIGEIWYPNLAVDAYGNVYAEYYDAADSLKLSVMKFATATSVNSVNANNNVSVFPNPAREKLTVISDKLNEGKLEIFNVLGECVFIENNLRTTNYELNTSNLPAGIYIYEVSGDRMTNSSRGKFVKN